MPGFRPSHLRLPADGLAREQLQSAVKNQISNGAQQPGNAGQALCQQLLNTCNAPSGPIADQNLCNYIQTPAGKVACGLAYPATGADAGG